MFGEGRVRVITRRRLLEVRRTIGKVTVPNHRGFSLLEVIGVLAVMGILIALIAPNVLQQIDAASRDGEDGTLQGIAQAVETSLQENRSWPSSLSDLSPNYTSFGDTQLTQNRGAFPRYYVPHPTISSFSNAAGLDPNDLDDARYLLISNLSSDAAPSITNATEFDAWWNTDETGIPDLKIYRGNLGRMFRLLSLTSNGIGGSYTIDGTTTNPGCSTLSDHTRYHLHGTPVGLDEASTYATPEVNFGLEKDITYQFHSCGRAAGSQWRENHGPKPYCWALWLTTDGNVSGSGAPCLDSWDDGEIIQFGNPNLAFEPGTTIGTFSSVINLDNFAQDGVFNATAVHYVTKNITVGATNSFDLIVGDLLLAHNDGSSENLTSTNSLSVEQEDVFVFRPDTPGDYSSGSFFMLLDDLSGAHVHSISLIENDTVVGDTTLSAGTFLFSRSGGNEKNDIWHFSATNVGLGTTSGTISLFLDSNNIGINKEPHGLDLIETAITIGSTTLPAGSILVTLTDDDNNVGDNSINTKQQDIFYLEVTSTEIGSGSSAADATLLFEGADVGLNTTQEDISGITVATVQ